MTFVTKPKDQHIHKFDKPVTQKVLLTSGRLIGQDQLLQRVCSCGKTQTYDLVRLDGSNDVKK